MRREINAKTQGHKAAKRQRILIFFAALRLCGFAFNSASRSPSRPLTGGTRTRRRPGVLCGEPAMAVLVYLAYKTLRRNGISFLLLVLAVAAGVGFQVPNTANIDGYTAELKDKGLARDTGHVLISSP